MGQIPWTNKMTNFWSKTMIEWFCSRKFAWVCHISQQPSHNVMNFLKQRKKASKCSSCVARRWAPPPICDGVISPINVLRNWGYNPTYNLKKLFHPIYNRFLGPPCNEPSAFFPKLNQPSLRLKTTMDAMPGLEYHASLRSGLVMLGLPRSDLLGSSYTLED